MAHVRIEELKRVHTCETCGMSIADGGRVYVDGELKFEFIPIAHCFNEESLEKGDIEREALRAVSGSNVYSTLPGYHLARLREIGHTVEHVDAEGRSVVREIEGC